MRTDGGYPKGAPREHIRDMSRMVIGPIHRSEGLVGRYPRGHLRDPGVQILSHQIRRSSNPEVMKSEVMKSEVVDLDTGIPKHSKRQTNTSDGCQLESQIRQYAECVQWCPPGHMAYRCILAMLHILMMKTTPRGYTSTSPELDVQIMKSEIQDMRY